jgi:multidrug resistance efflux pump
LIARLDAAKRRVKLGQDQIDRQSRLVATLFATGGELEEAENRLRVYQKLQRHYVADVERIADALEHTYL